MEIKISRFLEMLLIVLLVLPATALSAVQELPLSLPNMIITNHADAQRASALFNNLQQTAQRVKREIGPIQVNEVQLGWESQGWALNRVRSDVNTMANDLMQLDAMKNKLEPWQERLLHRVTPCVHELVYQTDAAIKHLGSKQNAMALALTQYPENINIIASQTGRIIRSVHTFTQYQVEKSKLAGLFHRRSPHANS